MYRKLIISFISFGIMLNLNATAINKLDQAMKNSNSLLCVGLDPDPMKIPHEIMHTNLPVEEKVFSFLKNVVDLTAPHVCAYKIQKAFFDQFDQGHKLIVDIVAYIRDKHPTIPVFIDCKIGDTDNTMQTYMHIIFDQIKADAVVVNPYMGEDVVQPFLKDPNKTAIILAQTSNPNGDIVQEIELKSGEKLWERIVDLTVKRWNNNQNMMLVLSSNTRNKDYRQIRRQIPQNMPILLAGIGAQGGDVQVLKDLLNDEGRGVFVNSSRGILYNYLPDSQNWKQSIVDEAVKLKNNLNDLRSK